MPVFETTPPEVHPPFPPGHEPAEPRGTTSPAGLVLPPRLRALVRDFDEAVDRSLDGFRGTPVADKTMYALSELADFSLMWHLIGTARALRSDRHRKEAVRLSVILGIESLVVNWGIKSLFKRVRPVRETAPSFRLRQPLTNSFPSGHASAAFTAATILSEHNPSGLAYYGLATLVATSRIYVKIHHPSDVVAGAAVGLAFGHIARRRWPAPRSGE